MDSDSFDSEVYILEAAVHHLAEARRRPEVQALAACAGFQEALGFAYPNYQRGPPRWPGFQAFVLPLVRAGLDTDENLTLLFGNPEAVRRCQRELRMYVLSAPPPGSPAYMLGLRGPEPANPDLPAAPAVLEALPRWQRMLQEGEELAGDCSICHRELVGTVQGLPGCSHLYHPGCILSWLQRKSTCPLCRTPVPDCAPRPPSAEERRELAEMQRFQEQYATQLTALVEAADAAIDARVAAERQSTARRCRQQRARRRRGRGGGAGSAAS